MAQSAGKRIIVLGGGISGLSYTHYLRRFAAAKSKSHLLSKITLIEANDYLGGSVKSKVFDDGTVHEYGPRSVRAMGAASHNTITLLDQLGLANQVMNMDTKAANRYIYKGGRLHRVASSPRELFINLPDSKSSYVSVLLKEFFLNKRKLDLGKYKYRDPPIYDFIKNTLGEDAAECLVDPIMRGITSGDARHLSTKALFGSLLDKYDLYGTVTMSFLKASNLTARVTDDLFQYDIENSELHKKMMKEQAPGYNLRSGLQALPEHLCYSLMDSNEDGVVSLHNQTQVTAIKFRAENEPDKPPCSVEVLTVDGDLVNLEADHIISTIPAANLTDVLPIEMPTYQRAALNYITTIPHAPVGCVIVEYRDWEGATPEVMNSFGLLTQSKEGRRILGISFDSSMFPEIDKQHQSIRMTAMIGGAWFKEMVGTDNLKEVTNARLEQIALEEIEAILGIKKEPYRMSTLLWKTGIAQYRPGHVDHLQQTRRKIKESSMPITLLGQSYDGVSVNDVMFEARLAANNFVTSL